VSSSIRNGLQPPVARMLMTLEFLVAVKGKIFGWSGQAPTWLTKGVVHRREDAEIYKQ
jgi:hypothetical protein